MALDDIVDEIHGTKKKERIGRDGAEAAILKQTLERIKEGEGRSESGNYDKGVMQLVLKNSGDLPPEFADFSILDLLSAEELNPIIDKYLPGAYKTAKKNLVKDVETEYTAILGEIDGNSMLKIVSDMPVPMKVEKEYEPAREAQEMSKKYSKIAEKEDVGAYLKTIKNKLIKEILEKAEKRDKKEVLKYAQIRAQIEQTKFLGYFANDTRSLFEALKEKDLVAINKQLKTDKLREYITGGIKGDKKPEDTYESIGIAYTGYQQRKEMEKRSKEAKESLEKKAA
jgi:hypothetical protein